MIITSSHTIEGQTIKEYLGIVSAAQVMVMPGGNKMVQRGWQAGVDGAVEAMKQQASAMGADAIISTCFAPFGSNICATGSAVKLG